MSELPLNSRQEQFVTYYLTEPSATRAAIMAGYGEKNARSQASTLLRNPAVVARVAELRRQERLRYRLTKDDALDWYEAAKHAAFAAGNWREVRLIQDRQCQLEFILPHAGGARRLGQADINALADLTADAMLNRGAPMEAIQAMSWDGVRRVHDEKLRRAAREARIAEYEKTVRKRMNDGKLPFDPAAFMPTADEQEKAAEEAAELAALKAQPGATVGPLKGAPPPTPPVVADWTPPPLPADAEERMAEVVAGESATSSDTSPSPLRGGDAQASTGRGGGETHVPNQAASPPPDLPPQGGGEEGMGEEEEGDRDGAADPDKARQNPTKPYTGESWGFAAQENGAPVLAGAPLNENRLS